MTYEYKQGQDHKKAGHSIAYNPYRHRGTAKQFTDWVEGYNS